MKIALDFDETYTRDPSLWRSLIFHAQDRHHEVFVVTARCETKDGIHPDWLPPCPVIFCDGRPKREVTRERGIQIDVWIDDDPYSLIHGSQHSPEVLREWREKDIFGHPDATGEGRPNATANGQQSPQGNAGNDRRPRLFSRRDRGNSGGVPQG